MFARYHLSPEPETSSVFYLAISTMTTWNLKVRHLTNGLFVW